MSIPKGGVIYLDLTDVPLDGTSVTKNGMYQKIKEGEGKSILIKSSDGNSGVAYLNTFLYTISAAVVMIYGQFPVDIESGTYAMIIISITDEDAVKINIITGE